MYFVMDALANGRRIKCLTCVGDFTKECLTITAAFGISGVQVTRILDSIALFRGYPTTIRTVQGPEFTCRALDQWAFEHGVELRLSSQVSQRSKLPLALRVNQQPEIRISILNHPKVVMSIDGVGSWLSGGG
jgi:transposase InsO family protein